MKKKLNNYISLVLILALLFTDFAPFLKVPNVKAEVVTEGVNLTGVENDGTIALDLFTNPEVVISIDNADYTLYCNTTDYQIVYVSESDPVSCKLTANDFGMGTAIFRIVNNNDSSIEYERLYFFDTGAETYLNNILNRIPDSMYSNVNIGEYISSFIPNIISFSTNQIDDATMNVELYYYYSTYDGENYNYDNHISAQKNITLLPTEDGNMYIYLPALDVGDSQTVSFSWDSNPNYNNLVWTSDDPSIATVDANGLVTGVSYGRTYINVLDRVTKKTARTEVIVRANMSLEEQITEVQNYLSGTLIIDPATIDIYINDYDNPFYQEILYIYLNDFFQGMPNGMSASSATCDGNACSVSIGYWDQLSQMQQSFDVNFNVVLKGIYVRSISMDCDDLMTSYLYYHVFDGSGVTEIEYNNEYLTVEDEGEDYFVLSGHKIGSTSINLINGDYVASTMISILPYFGEVTGYMDSIRQIELPYNSNEIIDNSDLTILEDLISEKVRSEYPNDAAQEFLSVDVDCFNSNKCKITLDFNIVNHNTSSVWADITYTNSVSFNLLKTKMEAINSSYDVTLDDSIVLADECNNANCIINNAFTYTALDTLMNTTIDVKGSSYLMPNIPKSVTYLVTVEDPLGTFTKEVTVNLDYIIAAPVTLEDSEEARVDFLNDKISTILDKDVTSLGVGNNKYKIDDKYYVYLDKKDQVELISFNPINSIIEVDIDETDTIRLNFYPVNSNVYDLAYTSSNPNVATVTNDGVVTGVSEGSATISISYNNCRSTVLVLVDISIEDYLNTLLSQVPDEVELDYADFAYNDLESVIENKASNYIFNNNIWIGGISTNVQERGGKYYLTVNYTNYSPYEQYSSDEKEITYIIKGIKVASNRYELDVDDEVDIGLEFSEGDNINIEVNIINPDIISYDNGVIKALKPGISTIYFNDKYNEYYNYVKVVVDKSSLLYGFSEFLTDKEIIIDYMYLTDENSLNTAFDRTMYDLYNEYFGTWDLIGDGESIDCNALTQKCTYSLMDNNYTTIFNKVFDYTLRGIELDSNEDVIEVNEHLPITYEVVGTTNNVSVTSLDTNICIIDNDDIVGVNPGVCTIKYTNGEYTNYKHVFVSTDDYVDDLETAMGLLPDSLEIDLDPYVTPEDLGWDMEVYYVSITEKLKSLIEDQFYESDYVNVYVSIDDLETLEDGYVDVFLAAYYSFEDYENRLYYNSDFAISMPKQITVTFNGITDENREIAENIKSVMRDRYELSLTQYMKYRLDIESGTVGNKSLIDYSNFNQDLSSVCDDCEFKFIGGYGNDDITNPVQGGVILFYRNGTAITYIESEIKVDISVTQAAGEILTEEEYINRVIEVIKDAYREAVNANLTLASLVGMYRLAVDDVEVTVEKSFNEFSFKPEYTFTVNNDFKFTTSVETKVTGTKVYEAYVTGVNVDKTTINLKVGETSTVTATVTPDNAKNKGVTWISNNPGIISVNNGVITALSVGTGTVTVKTDEGDFTKVITVNVSAVSQPTEPEQPVDQTKLGDVNRDGVINIADLIKLRKFVAGIDNLGSLEQKNADINKDNSVNIVDIVKLRKHLAGLEEI